MSSRLSEIMQQLQNLPPKEIDELRNLLEHVSEARAETPASSLTEDEFELQMKAKGFLRQVLPPVTEFSPYDDYQPVTVQGQPLSEMIVEERR